MGSATCAVEWTAQAVFRPIKKIFGPIADITAKANEGWTTTDTTKLSKCRGGYLKATLTEKL